MRGCRQTPRGCAGVSRINVRQVAGRLSWEDEVLHNEFGKEWEAYANRVPWRILPGVL